jgi:hypothetical protein
MKVAVIVKALVLFGSASNPNALAGLERDMVSVNTAAVVDRIRGVLLSVAGGLPQLANAMGTVPAVRPGEKVNVSAPTVSEETAVPSAGIADAMLVVAVV